MARIKKLKIGIRAFRKALNDENLVAHVRHVIDTEIGDEVIAGIVDTNDWVYIEETLSMCAESDNEYHAAWCIALAHMHTKRRKRFAAITRPLWLELPDVAAEVAHEVLAWSPMTAMRDDDAGILLFKVKLWGTSSLTNAESYSLFQAELLDRGSRPGKLRITKAGQTVLARSKVVHRLREYELSTKRCTLRELNEVTGQEFPSKTAAVDWVMEERIRVMAKRVKKGPL